jgi:hypothetical protein
MRLGTFRKALVASAIAVVSGASCLATAQEVPTGKPVSRIPAAEARLTSDELSDLVAPLALYPDALLSQVLVASTYPLELVEAQQWLKRNEALRGQETTEAAKRQRWDASVQALVAFPDVLARLTEDVEWTTDLGNAFLAQQQDVLAAVQRLRARAWANGRLASNARQTVSTVEQDGVETIEIAPAEQQVIYAPDYDPGWVWGAPLWAAYPPLGYAPGWAYGPPVNVGFWFGPWVGWGWGWAWGWGWGMSWHGGGVHCNAGFYQHHGYRGYGGHGGHGGGHPGPGGYPGGPHGGQQAWAHNPGHRAGVPYPAGHVAGRYQAASQAARGATPVARSWNRPGGGSSVPSPGRTNVGRLSGTSERPGRTAGDAWRGGGQGGLVRVSPSQRYAAPSRSTGYSAGDRPRSFSPQVPRSPSVSRYSSPGGGGHASGSGPSRSGGGGSPRSSSGGGSHSFSSPGGGGGGRGFSGGGGGSPGGGGHRR